MTVEVVLRMLQCKSLAGKTALRWRDAQKSMNWDIASWPLPIADRVLPDDLDRAQPLLSQADGKHHQRNSFQVQTTL